MNFDNPNSYTIKDANLRGLNYKYVDISTNDNGDKLVKGTFVLVHGFPDTWFTWHNVVKQLVAAGYRCVIPSLVGFCGTDTPDDLKRYTRVEMALDIEGLLDHLNIPQVYAVGHDWGSLVVQRLAAVSPSRIKKMVLMSIPFAPPARVKHSIDSLVEKGYDKLKYQLLWRDDETIRRLDSSEDLLKSFFASLFSLPDEKAVRPDGYEWQQLGSEKWAREIHPQTAHQSSLLGKAYLWHVSQFRKYGMRGPCSQYKVWELNTELELELPVQVKTPFLQIIFNGEATLNEDQKRKAVEASNDHVKTMLVEDGKTHWYILEKPDLISKHLLEYVGGTKSSL